MIKKILTVLIVIFAMSACYGEVNDNIDIEKMTIKQLNELPKDKIENLPAVPLMTKIFSEDKDFEKHNKISQQKFIIGMIELALNYLKFYYQNPTGIENSHLTDAIKKFQMSIGKPGTGVLTAGEFSILMNNKDLVMPDGIDLPGFTGAPSVYRSGGYVSAEGTWIIVGENIAYPIQISKIRCIKDEKTCIEANAYIATFGDNSRMLNVELEDYYITKWDDEEVTADTSGGCRVATLIINTKQKEVSSITRNYNESECEIIPGKSIPKLEKPRVSRLVGGYDVSKEYNLKQGERRSKVFNPEYMKAVRSLFPSDKPTIISSPQQ